MPQFLVSSKDINDNIVRIYGDEFYHITHVLRKKEGDSLNLFDENKKQFIGVIVHIDNTYADIRIVEYKTNQVMQGMSFITLYQCIPKFKKFEFIIEKATELGVKRIVPVLSKFVVVKLDDKSIKSKMNRWQEIAKSAAKQSCSPVIPEIDKPIKFKDAVKGCESDLKFIGWEHGKKHLKDVVSLDKKDVAIFIGSEGGFSEDEIAVAEANKIRAFRLKGNILRAETAPISIISILNYEFGWM